jgi:hypothetical protein
MLRKHILTERPAAPISRSGDRTSPQSPPCWRPLRRQTTLSTLPLIIDEDQG